VDKPCKILFLYTELAGYFLACVDALAQRENVEVHIVRWPINKEAPFDFEFSNDIHFYDKKEYSLQQLEALAEEINPDVIYASGWIDKEYLKVCKKYKSSIPVIVGFDNQWTGGVKQQMARLLSPVLIHKYFNRAWVPGEPQYQFARKLGFKPEHILQGVYSADTKYFHQFYEKYREQKEKNLPKRFIYVGRYLEFKGVLDMWQSFEELCAEEENEWELWCLGVGDLEATAPKHPKIKHFGFVQPKALEQYIADTSVFILPSHFEPWGVVIHEYAAAGFPIISSDKVGAATYFLKEGKNGYGIESGNKASIKKAMKTMMSKSDEELLDMGKESVAVALTLTPETWADTLLNVLK
jgi:glycosyltransferase involved in cell wall biosynthesis